MNSLETKIFYIIGFQLLKGLPARVSLECVTEDTTSDEFSPPDRMCKQFYDRLGCNEALNWDWQNDSLYLKPNTFKYGGYENMDNI